MGTTINWLSRFGTKTDRLLSQDAAELWGSCIYNYTFPESNTVLVDRVVCSMSLTVYVFRTGGNLNAWVYTNLSHNFWYPTHSDEYENALPIRNVKFIDQQSVHTIPGRNIHIYTYLPSIYSYRYTYLSGRSTSWKISSTHETICTQVPVLFCL